MEHFPEIVGGLTGAGVSARVLYNVLGPPSTALGRRLEKSVDEFHLARLAEVVKNAATKVNPEEGTINERALGAVTDESAWIDDTVVVDYLGGVLASAKTKHGRDDRGVIWAKTIGQMSAYQLRAHFIFYSVARELCVGVVESVGDGVDLMRGNLFIPEAEFYAGMEFGDEEDADALTGHILFGLSNLGLIHHEFSAGTPEFLANGGKVLHAPCAGMYIPLTAPGVELYMWGHGKGTAPLDVFLDLNEPFESAINVRLPTNAVRTADVRPPITDVESTEAPPS
jgi:hypothetical protein